RQLHWWSSQLLPALYGRRYFLRSTPSLSERPSLISPRYSIFLTGGQRGSPAEGQPGRVVSAHPVRAAARRGRRGGPAADVAADQVRVVALERGGAVGDPGGDQVPEARREPLDLILDG